MMLGLKTLASLLPFLSTVVAVVEVNEWECWGSKYRILLKRYTDRECKNKIGEENKRDLVCSGKCKSWKKDPPFGSAYYHYAAHKSDYKPDNKACTIFVYDEINCDGYYDWWNATEGLGM
ncbi:hypothetical protein LTR10_012486 [Elasticomyces elasticus]|nr:hypothetical protein LTR10_012486 [Elasticomyces elasticus]KAK4965960.1 hypothetical protein LTR42_011974 [Elasticomyces elasticus]